MNVLNGLATAQRLVICLCCTTLIFLATACWGQSRPSEKDGRAVLEHSTDAAYSKTVSFKKTDGQDFNAFGVQGYTMSYDVTFECTGPSGCCAKPSISGCYQEVNKGGQYTMRGKLSFTKSEKGWSGKIQEQCDLTGVFCAMR